jgi:hypothetical protein
MRISYRELECLSQKLEERAALETVKKHPDTALVDELLERVDVLQNVLVENRDNEFIVIPQRKKV